MRLRDAIGQQPEHSAVLYEGQGLTLQRTMVVEEDSLEDALEHIPWTSIVYFRCDRQRGGKRVLLYRWKPEQDEWEKAM